MSINFCPNCGAKLKSNAKFCGNCGEKIISAQSENFSPMPYEISKSVTEVKPQSVQDIFSNAKASSYTPPPQPNYNFSQGEVYREDTTIKEMFFSTDGRLNRLRYFKRGLVIGIVGTILMLCVIVYGVSSLNTETTALFSMTVMLPCWVSSYCLNVRRLKDIGEILGSELSESSIQLTAGSILIIDLLSMFLSGYALIGAYSIIFVFGLYILFKPGVVGSNKFGPDPLDNTRRFYR